MIWMIFKEQSSIDLSQYEMLTEDESKVNINTVPIVENSRICTNIVNFDDIERIPKNFINYIYWNKKYYKAGFCDRLS